MGLEQTSPVASVPYGATWLRLRGALLSSGGVFFFPLPVLSPVCGRHITSGFGFAALVLLPARAP